MINDNFFQAGNVQKVHEQNEVMRKKLDECKTIEKVLKDSTNQVSAGAMNLSSANECKVVIYITRVCRANCMYSVRVDGSRVVGLIW